MRCKQCNKGLPGFRPKEDDGLCKACRTPAAVASPEPPKADPILPVAVVLPPLPEGHRYIYNRTDAEYEQFFDGRPINFQAHETKVLTSEQAYHLRAHSIIRGTLRPGGRGALIAERSLACGPGWTILRWNKVPDTSGTGNDRYIAEYVVAEPEKEFHVPTSTTPGTELFDRQAMPNYTDRPTPEGRPTHVEIVRV